MRNFIYTISILLLSLILIACGQQQDGKSKTTPTEVSSLPLSDNTESQADFITPTTPDSVLDSYTENLFPAFQIINNSRLYGYIDQTGQFVIEPQYDSATFFIHSLAVVSQDGTYKVINPDGVVLFENDGMIREFKNGYAAFYQTIDSTSLIGFINTECDIIIPPSYLDASDFDEDNTAIVSNTNHQYQQISTDGSIQKELPKELQSVNIQSVRDGYWIFTDSSSLQGVKNLDNKIILPPIYPKIYNLGYGLFAVSDPSNLVQNSATAALGICDITGKLLTDYIYYEVDIFQGDYASASDDKSTFFIDKKGQPVPSLPTVTGMGSLHLCGDVIYSLIDKDFYYLTKNGETIWKADRSSSLNNGIVVEPYTFRPNRFTLITYPQLKGLEDENVQAKINDRLQKLFHRDPNSILTEYQTYVDDNYQVNLNKDLIEIIKHGYDYTVDAAHGMPIWEHYYIDLNSGNQYSLDDLFKKDSFYLTRLNHILDVAVNKRAQNEDSMIFIESYTGFTENPRFILEEDHLCIYFYPYEISGYAAGFQSFDVPYQQVSDLINISGDLWNSYHHTSIDSSLVNPEDILEPSMEAFIKHYETASNLAVILDHFDTLKPFLVKDNRYYKYQKERIATLANDEVYEKILSCDVEKVESMNTKGDYKVYARITSSINYPDNDLSTETKSYIYTIVPAKQKHLYQVADRSPWITD